MQNTDTELRISRPLLDWFEENARDLPWRVRPQARARGRRPDPYRVWLSEIMLQQTTIAHGTRYFIDFTRRWPSVHDLAAAADEEVMAAWAGLGYYARARNLLKCAREIVARGGEFPETEQELRTLPGIGPYTSGAIAAIAFGQKASAVDGNVERVVARLLTLDGDWKAQKARIKNFVDAEVPLDRSGEFAEALMDLGAMVCTPRRPDCARCPLARGCLARTGGAPESYPRKPKKAAQQARRGAVLVSLSGAKGERLVGLERRPGEGLLGGMLGLPGSDWTTDRTPGTPPPGASDAAVWIGEITHIFTHIRLSLDVFVVEASAPTSLEAYPVEQALQDLPSVFQKALRKALGVGYT